jgi:hypothetical protein
MIIHGTFVIKHCNFVSLNEHSFFFISFKQRICDANKFESIRISSKCNVEQILKEFTIKNSKWQDFKKTIASLYMHLFLIEIFLLEQVDPLENFYSIMEKINTIFFLNEPLIMQYMLNHVLSHDSDQMVNNQESMLVNNV